MPKNTKIDQHIFKHSQDIWVTGTRRGSLSWWVLNHFLKCKHVLIHLIAAFLTCLRTLKLTNTFSSIHMIFESLVSRLLIPLHFNTINVMYNILILYNTCRQVFVPPGYVKPLSTWCGYGFLLGRVRVSLENPRVTCDNHYLQVPLEWRRSALFARHACWWWACQLHLDGVSDVHQGRN